MLPARLLPERWLKLVQEAVKFGLVGALNTVLNFLVFNALIFSIFRNGPLKANVIATLVALTVSFFMNRHWTYRDRPNSAVRREYTLFFFFNGVGLAIELGVLGLTKYGLGLESVMAINSAKLLGVMIGTVFRFWSYRTFVFRPERITVVPPATRPSVAAEPATIGHRAEGPPASGGSESLEQPTLDLELELELAVELDAAQPSRAD